MSGESAILPTSIGWYRRLDGEALLPVLILPICLCILGPWWSIYEIHPDEGVNLIKGALVANGFHLYDQIWSDQPPVLTLILAVVHLAYPFSVAAARTSILAFSCLLLWSLFRVVRRTDGSLAAWVTVAALGLSNLYLTLSVSVMIGLPAIALAICAIDQAMLGASKRQVWRYLLAGVLLGLSLQIKMFTALILPSLVCAVLFVPRDPVRRDRRRARDVILVLAAVLATFIGIAFAMHEPFLSQLIYPHLWTPGVAAEEAEPHGWIYFGRLLFAVDPAVLGLGIAGAVAVLTQPRDLYGARLIPVLWLCLAVITFSYHRPVWPHHLPMTLVPLAWLGGIAVASCVTWLYAVGARKIYALACAAGFFALLIAAKIWDAPDFYGIPLPRNPIVTAMVAFKTYPPAEKWVVTDDEMDAYRAGVLIPPELAVFTGKRVSHGYLPPDTIISVIRERQPSQVMFRRFTIDSEVKRYLDTTYVRLIWSREPHYIRSDLVHARTGTNGAAPAQ